MKKKIILFLIICIYIITPKNTFAETTLKITNKLENIRNTINANITYKITPHAENPTGVENDISSYKIYFDDTEVIDNTITKEDVIDFSNINYTIPGTYRYGIKQLYTSDTNILLKTNTYEIYVLVTKELDDSIKVDVQPLVFDFKELEKKELEFTNEVDYTNLTIEQKVQGDYKEFDKNTYFKYKITFYSKVGNKYTITGQDDIINYEDEKIETTNEYIVKDEENENYVYIYLKEGQKVTIGLNELDFNEIPHDTEYTITKIGQEKWSTTINGKETNKISLRTKNKENKVVIINSRDYDDAVTGLFYNSLPFIIIIIIVVILFFIYKKINNKEE